MMTKFKLLLAALFFSMALAAQINHESVIDPLEIRLERIEEDPTETQQRLLRESSAWGTWSVQHPRWRAIMSNTTGLPHRAFGPAMEVPGSSLEEKAQHFISNSLTAFGVEGSMDWQVQTGMGRHDWAFAIQEVNGIPVEGGRLTTKWLNGELVLWGADWYRDAMIPEGDMLSELALLEAATAGVNLDEWADPVLGDYRLVPTADDEGNLVWHLVQSWMISGRDGAVPRRYQTWVDVHSGEVLMRVNEVKHIDGRWSVPAMEGKPERVVRRMGIDRPAMFYISGSMQSEVHEMYPFEDPADFTMPHLQLPFNGETIYTDADGGFTSNTTGPQFINVGLQGLWSTVYTDGVTPSTGVNFEDGYSIVSINELGNLKERSAYRSVSRIHEHMKAYMPGFTDLDFSLTTNIDVEGECNAFYDGISINFYDMAGGCNPTSLIADVVWHEYGHGINGYFYSSLGANFNNGAMGEGYADLWAMSLGDIAEIGKGFYTDNNDGIRRYDQEPKVYPEDLVGEVHADGEIICGAWYDTHLLLGGDWPSTMDLFIDAYAGLQATTQNGNEGQAFTDVLIDALQADDDDGDLSNGTPNDLIIVEGFDIHGISVFSYAEIDHDPMEFAAADEVLVIEGEADILFPYSLYFSGVKLWYQTESGGDWTELDMVNADGGSLFEAELPAQSNGSVVAYYMGIVDDFGGLSAVTPMAAANDPYPNLPHFVLVGVDPILVNDSDEYSDFGNWTTGLPGEDSATTGQWEESIPVGSYAEMNDPSTIVAPVQDHTLGFAGYAFITGLNPGVNDGIGVNDVDAGHTTLLSPIIDLTAYANPIMSYWRWYTNAPASGANPATDWWQVELSGDGGATWQYLENTLQQDISWRRMAFRVADVMDVTSEFQMRFIASDSTTMGEYLDGGSLIEAALDDIILYDASNPDGVAEVHGNEVTGYPNPAAQVAQSSGWMPGSTVYLVETGSGKRVATARAGGSGQVQWNVGTLANGLYLASGSTASGRAGSWTFEVQH
ncbi:MAG: hypothetical protein ACKVJH_04720 [Flavobacteriales bacterium]